MIPSRSYLSGKAGAGCILKVRVLVMTHASSLVQLAHER